MLGIFKDLISQAAMPPVSLSTGNKDHKVKVPKFRLLSRRKLVVKVQTELAEANSVAEEALSSMPTVKAHAAEDSAFAAYHSRLRTFYTLQVSAWNATH